MAWVSQNCMRTVALPMDSWQVYSRHGNYIWEMSIFINGAIIQLTFIGSRTSVVRTWVIKTVQVTSFTVIRDIDWAVVHSCVDSFITDTSFLQCWMITDENKIERFTYATRDCLWKMVCYTREWTKSTCRKLSLFYHQKKQIHVQRAISRYDIRLSSSLASDMAPSSEFKLPIIRHAETFQWGKCRTSCQEMVLAGPMIPLRNV